MRWLIVMMLVLAAACTPTETPPSTMYEKERIGFDVTRDPAVSGQYITSGSYVDGQGVIPGEVRWNTLLKGLEAARKDGYDLVVWSSPATMGGTQRIDYRSMSSPSTSHLQTQFRGFVYVVRGYKSNGGAPSEARPVGGLIDQVRAILASGKL
ncbi:hypothetical protein [Reyranella sp.]|uniref:hypothetical protein n=1 Tax=Reyranella sp. TaxID=1929291 RepID=UPI003D130342